MQISERLAALKPADPEHEDQFLLRRLLLVRADILALVAVKEGVKTAASNASVPSCGTAEVKTLTLNPKPLVHVLGGAGFHALYAHLRTLVTPKGRAFNCYGALTQINAWEEPGRWFMAKWVWALPGRFLQYTQWPLLPADRSQAWSRSAAGGSGDGGLSVSQAAGGELE